MNSIITYYKKAQKMGGFQNNENHKLKWWNRQISGDCIGIRILMIPWLGEHPSIGKAIPADFG